ncbi:Protein of unknown function [Pyronema omphalodes CBS 100304]|uniref:Uncharacterized protein n=1 Tax=Pyronema omphalodes (strain CBS 100304) TaxID=1076935 RepID=U4KXY3_PYROM|nr:Protein of unknown function [Pyronema omphalodes CBS 100304]
MQVTEQLLRHFK